MWRSASSVSVCFLCSWRHVLRLLTESFRAFKFSLNDVISFFTSSLNSMILPCIDLMEEAILARFVAIEVAAEKIQAINSEVLTSSIMIQLAASYVLYKLSNIIHFSISLNVQFWSKSSHLVIVLR